LCDKSSIYFAELGKNKLPDYTGRNNEYVIRLSSKVIMPDFYDEKSKKIIEFDRTYWHGKHIIRSSNVKREQDRNMILIEEGYKVLHIKEEDYRNDPENMVKLCLEFLNG
jgi:very-short-patch-repair endonuclease